MTHDAEDDLRRQAERRADAKLAFRGHLLTYIVVIGGLAALNLMTNPGYLWFGWAAFGWGIGLVAHGFSTYAWRGEARERMIQKELERLRGARR